MPIEYLEGDLIAALDETVIAHGCNARGAFGSGFAGALNGRIPEAREAYMKAYASGRLRLGGIVWARSGLRLIANCIIQPTFGRSGVHIDYESLRQCMGTLNRIGRDGVPSLPGGFRRVAMPLIGADRGGGDWSRISAIIEDELTDVAPAVYYLPMSGFRPPRTPVGLKH